MADKTVLYNQLQKEFTLNFCKSENIKYTENIIYNIKFCILQVILQVHFFTVQHAKPARQCWTNIHKSSSHLKVGPLRPPHWIFADIRYPLT